MSQNYSSIPGPDEKDVPDVEYVHFVKYADGELFWRSEHGDSEESTGQLKEANITLIVQQTSQQQSDPEGNYRIYSLVEESSGSPFRLLSYVVTNTLPRHILEKYLVTKLPDHLVCNEAHRLTIVVSTNSGLCQAETFYQQVLRYLLGAFGLAGDTEWSEDKDRGKYEVIFTKSDQTVKELGKQLSESPTSGQARTIVLLSGDGGVVDLLNGPDQASSSSSGPNPTIVLIPLGTGNALFHSLHKPLYAAPRAPSHYVLGLRTLFKGIPAPLPTFEASFASGSRLISYSDSAASGNAEDVEGQRHSVSRLVGAIVASYGFHASLVWESDTPEYRKHGAQRFHMAAGELLKLGHGYDVDVEVRVPGAGPEEWTRLGNERDKFGYVLATLVSSLEKTFTISPASKPLDGKLRLVTFGDVGGDKTMDVMKAAYDNGSHVGMKWALEDGREEKVGYEEVEEVKITVQEDDARWRKVCVDGTIVELPPKGGWMRVRTSPESRFDIVVDRAMV
jgi:diacylglycerol kinase family enzyme